MPKNYRPLSLLTDERDSTNFADAESDLRAALRAQIPEDFSGVPALNPDKWNEPAYVGDNCYKFAMDLDGIHGHTLDISKLQPGELSVIFSGNVLPVGIRLAMFNSMSFRKKSRMDFCEYAEYISQRAQDDGLKSLGHEFSVSARGFPLALFFSYPDPPFVRRDYHWYALRRVPKDGLRWASKLVGQTAETTPSASLFATAQRNGYFDFGGYYERPLDLV